MAFVKLDTGLLRSSLWVDRDQRSLFVTALLMAEPFEVKQQLAQIAVRSLDETGWYVPAGWYGMVGAAGVGIVRADGIDREQGLAALEALGAPDFESRSQDHDGRRLVRVNGGYLVLNYMKYRDYDHTAAERQQRLRDRKKAKHPAVTSASHAVTECDITQPSHIADADADAETETTNNLIRTVNRKTDVATEFAAAWDAYPRRAGANPRRDALVAFSARRSAGEPLGSLMGGLARYAAFCEATGKVGTEYVQQARRFFGPSGAWREAWPIPVAAPFAGGGHQSKADRTAAVLNAFLAKEAFRGQ